MNSYIQRPGGDLTGRLTALLEAARHEGGTTAQQLQRFFARVATEVEARRDEAG